MLITLGERADQLVMEIVELGSDRRLHAFIIHLARAVDGLAQALVKVVSLAAFLDLLLVVKLDLGNQQPRKPAGVVVQAALVLGNLDRKIDIAVAEAGLDGLGGNGFDDRLRRRLRCINLGIAVLTFEAFRFFFLGGFIRYVFRSGFKGLGFPGSGSGRLFFDGLKELPVDSNSYSRAGSDEYSSAGSFFLGRRFSSAAGFKGSGRFAGFPADSGSFRRRSARLRQPGSSPVSSGNSSSSSTVSSSTGSSTGSSPAPVVDPHTLLRVSSAGPRSLQPGLGVCKFPGSRCIESARLSPVPRPFIVRHSANSLS